MASKARFDYRALRSIDRAPGVPRLTDDWSGLRSALLRLMRQDMVRVRRGGDRGLYITDKGQKYYLDLQLGLIEWR